MREQLIEELADAPTAVNLLQAFWGYEQVWLALGLSAVLLVGLVAGGVAQDLERRRLYPGEISDEDLE